MCATSRLAFVVCIFVSLCPLLRAFPLYQRRIPNGGNVPGNPGLGHVLDSGAGSRNAFGNLFQSEGQEWTQTLCEADSDGDLYSNGFELGDPHCLWVKGNADPGGPLSDPTKASSLPVAPTLLPPTDSSGGPPLPRWSPLEEDLVCQVLVVGAGLAGMTAASVASSLGHEVCVLSASPPNASTSAASSGTLYLPLQGPFPDQASPLEFYAQERRDSFLQQAESAARHLEGATGATLEPVLDPYPTYSDLWTDRVVVLVEASASSSSGSGASAGWKCGGQLSMAETLARLERPKVLYRTGQVESLAHRPDAPSPSGRYVLNTTEGHLVSAHQVILASGGYGASRTDLSWKGALASGNDGLNLRVAQSVGTPTTKVGEGWFVEKGEQQIRWFLWEENATVVDQDYRAVPGYEPTDAYDARGRQRLAANKTDEDLWLLSSASDFCGTSPVATLPEPLSAANGSSLESANCGPSAELWYNFPACFGCPEKQVPCGSRLAEGTQECRRDRLELWVIDSNGGPVVDECNQFEGRGGLFAAGNAAPPMLGHAYLAPGSTLGNALVSAHVAASCLRAFPGKTDESLVPGSAAAQWPAWLVAHAVGMAFAWGYFFVLGHSQMLGRKKPRTKRHRWLQTTAVVLALLAAVSVLVGGSSPVVWEEYGAHPVLGLVAFVLVFTQLLLIALKKGVQHRYLGRALPFVLLLVLLSGLWVGLDLYSMPPAIFLLVFPAVLTLLLWSGHVALFLAFQPA